MNIYKWQVSSDKCKEIIIENGSTCLRQPDLYLGQIEEIDSQLIHQFDELVMPSAGKPGFIYNQV